MLYEVITLWKRFHAPFGTGYRAVTLGKLPHQGWLQFSTPGRITLQRQKIDSWILVGIWVSNQAIPLRLWIGSLSSCLVQ